jgi:spermidine/putrescine-binding protein
MLVKNKLFHWFFLAILACFLTIGCQKSPEETPLSTSNEQLNISTEQESSSSELVVYYDNKAIPQDILDTFANQHSLTISQKKMEDSNVSDGDLFIISPFTFLELSKDVSFADWTNPQDFPNFHPALMHHTFDGNNTKTLPLMWSPYVFYTPKAEQAKNPWTQWLDVKPASFPNDMVLLTKYRLKETAESANLAPQSKFTEVKNEVSGKLADHLKPADESWAAVQSGESHLTFLPLGYYIANQAAQANVAFHLPAKGTLIDFPQIAIRQDSRRHEKAKALASYLTSKEVQQLLSKETGYFTAVVTDKRKDPWEGCSIALPKGKWFSNSEYSLPIEKDRAVSSAPAAVTEAPAPAQDSLPIEEPAAPTASPASE